MIYLEMYGRLGNQFFRYAAARTLQLEFYPEEQLVINFNQIREAANTDPSFFDCLSDFNVTEYITYEKPGKVIANETSILQKITALFYYAGLRRFKPIQMNEELEYQKKWRRILNKVGLYWYRTGYCRIEKSRAKNKFLSGNFEAPEYFKKYEEQLRKEFTTKHPRLEKNSDLYNIIENTESVCVSIRRGDFESNEQNREVHSVCDKAYFLEAIDRITFEIEARGKSPVFILFSDDIDWARNNIATTKKTYHEDGTDPVWEKLRMMSLCRHFILSNSTFSWWSQFLSESKDKIVISPSRWFNNDYQSPLLDKNWIYIEK